MRAHPAGALARPRSGFLLALVLLISVVIGALALLTHQGMLHRHVQVQSATDRAGARFLARGALDALAFALAEACLPPPPGVAPTTNAQDLFSVFLSDPASLIAGTARARGEADDRGWLDRRLGAQALAPIDRLVAKLPGASVELTVSLAPAPLTTGPVRDAVQKTIVARLGARARVRTADDSLSSTQTYHVHSRLPLAGKFTLVAGQVGGLGSQRVLADGRPVEGTPAPIVLVHHPKDGDPLTADPFRAAAEKPLVARSVPASALVTAHADRGLVLLVGANAEAPVYLPVAGGGAPYGELSSVFRPEAGRVAALGAKPLADQPARLKAFDPTDPMDATIHLTTYVQGTIFGFFETMDATLLDQAPDGQPPSRSASRLKLFGTGAMPSPTAILGPVWRTLAAVSDLATDRDATDADEAAQAAAAGRNLPVRDGIEPFLAFATESEFEADLALEQVTGEVTYGRLPPFGDQGKIDNRNASLDVDGDGVGDVPVSSEAGREKIHLDLSQWRYENLFATYEEYRLVMSRHLAIPANRSLDLAAMPAEEALAILRAAAFGRAGPGPQSEWLPQALTLAHRDRMHQEPALSRGGGVYASTGRSSPAALVDAIEASIGGHPGSRPGPGLVVRGQRRFEERFMKNGVIDLGGLTVEVEPEPGQAGLAFVRPVAVKAGSGGTLITPSLSVPALLNPGEGDGFAPFTVRAEELTLTGKGPLEAIVRAGSVSVSEDVEHAIVKGSLIVPDLPGELARPLVVAWDPRLDPTGEHAPFQYRIAVARSPRIYRDGTDLR